MYTWPNNNDNDKEFFKKFKPLACHSDYTEPTHKDNCWDYSIGDDPRGPQFWSPSQCLKTYSWNKPKKPSPYIVTIGD